MAFRTLEGLNAQEQEAANVRTLTGDGTGYLFAPGLKQVTSVRVGSMPVPLIELREIPLDPEGKRLLSIPFPLIDLQFTPEGMPVLLRSDCSNDGVWQDGVPIYVGGEWELGSEIAQQEPATPRRGRPPLTN